MVEIREDMTEARVREFLASRARPGMPKYMLVQAVIVDMIEEGYWTSETKLPPEQEIGKMLGISLGTVQKALGHLTEDGIIYRQQGRGTFVAPHDRILSDPSHFRFLADDGKTLLPIFTKVLSRRKARTLTAQPGFFGSREQSFHCLRRIVDVNHEFNCFNLFYLGSEQFEGFDKIPFQDLHGSNLKVLLQRRFGVSTVRITNQIRPTQLTAEACEHIGCDEGIWGILLDIYGETISGRPVYYQRTFVPPNDRWLVPAEVTPLN